MGDSAALFIDPDTQHATELTEDHRLTNPRERQRLQDMGIQVGGCGHVLCVCALCVCVRARARASDGGCGGVVGVDSGARLQRGWRLYSPRSRPRHMARCVPPPLTRVQLASNARRLYGLNLCRGLGDKFLKDEDLGEAGRAVGCAAGRRWLDLAGWWLDLAERRGWWLVAGGWGEAACVFALHFVCMPCQR